MGTPSFDLYLDDSGSREPDHVLFPPRRDGLDHFALGGILLESERLSELIRAYEAFVDRHGIDYPLHSTKIRSRKDSFRWLEKDPERARRFYGDLCGLVCDSPGVVVACCVDRPGYNALYEAKYGNERWRLSKSAYTIVVERAVKYALRLDRKLNVYVEQTGKKEDNEIRRYHRDMIDDGMYFDKVNSGKYAPLSAEYFARTLFKEPRFVNKGNVPAQIADLVLYPVVKGGYDPSYQPYVDLLRANKLIDAHIAESEVRQMGIKYYCFDRREPPAT